MPSIAHGGHSAAGIIPRYSSRRPLSCRANIFSGLFGKGQTEQRRPQESSEQRQGVERFLNSSVQEKPVFPPYQVIKRTPTYDLRLYEVYPVVEMEYERREEAYGSLGGYIDGDNSKSIKFDYSQPVTMRYSVRGGPKMMSMYLSRKDSDEWVKASTIREKLALLPEPLNSRVSVGIRGGEVLAVRMFDGFITPSSAGEARRLLLESLKSDGISVDEETADMFNCGQYGAVYQVGGRLNELQMKIKL